MDELFVVAHGDGDEVAAAALVGRDDLATGERLGAEAVGAAASEASIFEC